MTNPKHVRFETSFGVGNAAFAGAARPGEVARILRGIADLVEAGGDSGNVSDINGNSIGWWSMDAASVLDQSGDEG